MSENCKHKNGWDSVFDPESGFFSLQCLDCGLSLDEYVKQQQQRIESLEQQLKTAKADVHDFAKAIAAYVMGED